MTSINRVHYTLLIETLPVTTLSVFKVTLRQYEYGAVMGWHRELKTEALGERVQVPRCSLYVPHALGPGSDRPLAVTSQQLTA